MNFRSYSVKLHSNSGINFVMGQHFHTTLKFCKIFLEIFYFFGKEISTILILKQCTLLKSKKVIYALRVFLFILRLPI